MRGIIKTRIKLILVGIVILIVWIVTLLYMTRPVSIDTPYRPQDHFERPLDLQPKDKIGV
jgi:hypothetical protein